MWFICSCVRPYIELEKIEDKMMYRMIVYNNYRPDIKKISWLKEPKLNELITQMWNKEPELRPDIKYVLKTIESNNIKNTTKVLLSFVSISLSNVQPRNKICKNKNTAERIPNVKK